MRRRAGRDFGERRARLRLRQRHRAEVAAFDHRLEPRRPLLCRSENGEQVRRALRQERIARRGTVRGTEDELRRDGHHVWQLHATDLGVVADAHETGAHERVDRRLQRRRRHDVVPGRRRFVGVEVGCDRGENVARDLVRRVDDRDERRDVVLGVARARRELAELLHLEELEVEIAAEESVESGCEHPPSFARPPGAASTTFVAAGA